MLKSQHPKNVRSRWYIAPCRLERDAEYLPLHTPDGSSACVVRDRNGCLVAFVSRATRESYHGNAAQPYKVWKAITGQGRVRIGALISAQHFSASEAVLAAFPDIK
jgi:hypothetical protein